MKKKKKKKNILENKNEFIIRPKRFFLTYPNVLDLPNLEKEFLCNLQNTFPLKNKNNVKYLIVKELHDNGIPHNHVYLEFDHQQHIYSREKLHVILIGPISKKKLFKKGNMKQFVIQSSL